MQVAGDTAGPRFVETEFEANGDLSDLARSHMGIASAVYDRGNPNTSALFNFHFDPTGAPPVDAADSSMSSVPGTGLGGLGGSTTSLDSGM